MNITLKEVLELSIFIRETNDLVKDSEKIPFLERRAYTLLSGSLAHQLKLAVDKSKDDEAQFDEQLFKLIDKYYDLATDFVFKYNSHEEVPQSVAMAGMKAGAIIMIHQFDLPREEKEENE